MIKRGIARIIASLLIACSIAVTGCDSGYECGIEKTSYNRIKFYNIDENKIENEYKFPEVLTVSLLINGKDSIVVNHITNTSNLQLPMSYTQDCDTLVFSYENNATDSLFVKHENIPYFISMECGLAMYHRILNVTHTNAYIDSVSIIKDYVNFDYNENIKLYFVK